jgi:hypothetical protein
LNRLSASIEESPKPKQSLATIDLSTGLNLESESERPAAPTPKPIGAFAKPPPQTEKTANLIANAIMHQQVKDKVDTLENNVEAELGTKPIPTLAAMPIISAP